MADLMVGKKAGLKAVRVGSMVYLRVGRVERSVGQKADLMAGKTADLWVESMVD